MTPEAVIVDAVRTPIGKRAGSLAGIHPADLSALVLQGLAARNHLDPSEVDDVLWGCVSQVGEQSAGIGRYAVLAAGWPESVPGVTINRACGSSQQALSFAAAGVVAGHYDIAIAGGVESMSRVPIGQAQRVPEAGLPFGPAVRRRYDNVEFNQGPGAELIARLYGLTREDLDQHALDSHARAAAAIDGGCFKDEILPVEVVDAQGATVVFDTDEGVRRNGTLERLAQLPTPFQDNGLVTAGNSSQISDGAAAMLVASKEAAERHGWTPMARVHTVAVAGSDPITMALGPIPATAKVLERSGLTLDDIGAYEINEAFAPVTLAWLRETGADYAKLNPLGGAMALGHPLGASGTRITATLLHHMRDQGIRYGLQAMCEAGGMANATIFELL